MCSMSDTKDTPRYNLPDTSVGHPAYPVAKVDAHALQPIDTQGKETQQDWRSLAHVLVKRALQYSRSFSKVDARKMQAIIHMASEANQQAYARGAEYGSRGPQHVLIALFGASGAGESIARNLQAMLPTIRTTDGIVDAEVVGPDTKTH